jgi:CTP synthase (UTP-ammonia lyase)
MGDAGHAEYGIDPETALITPAHCEVPEPGAPRIKGKQRVRLTPGSLAARIYGANEVFEEFHCSNELNRRYQPLFEKSDLGVVGVGDEGEARVVELAGAGAGDSRRFFVATLYLPQLAAVENGSHPLIDAFVRAVAATAR